MAESIKYEEESEKGIGQTGVQGSYVIPVIEEELHVDKVLTETGKVRITKSVTEEQQVLQIPYMQESVDVEHVVVNHYVDVAPDPVRYEGDTMIIPVIKEVVVVEKKIFLVEEIRVTRHQQQLNHQDNVTLRKETVSVERTNNNDLNQSSL